MIRLKHLPLVTAFFGAWCLSVPVVGQAADWNPLPDTGQKTCHDVYEDDENGNAIPCPAEGQPLHGQDAQYNGTTPFHASLEVNGDTIVRDYNTGLTWQQDTADTNDDGQVNELDKTRWQDALDYCRDLLFAGRDDWRLPDYSELESLVDYSRSNPAINPVFTCENAPYWSATSADIHHPGTAWAVYFTDGDVYWWDKLDPVYYVRCVRGGL